MIKYPYSLSLAICDAFSSTPGWSCLYDRTIHPPYFDTCKGWGADRAGPDDGAEEG